MLSPHLDDGVFSLGARMALASSHGVRVRLVTVLPNDPASDAPASEWDIASGFSSAAAAANGRRREDARAARLVGATPVWLPFAEESYRDEVDEAALLDALVDACASSDRVYVPGFPLHHADHQLVHRVVFAARDRFPRLSLYTEQPYAAWEALGDDGRPDLPRSLPTIGADALRWTALPRARALSPRKLAGCLAYRSQMRPIGYGALANAMRWELRYGAEPVADLD